MILRADSKLVIDAPQDTSLGAMVIGGLRMLTGKLLSVSRNLERIADHATNIAETVYYMVEGHPLVDERPKSNTTALSASK